MGGGRQPRGRTGGSSGVRSLGSDLGLHHLPAVQLHMNNLSFFHLQNGGRNLESVRTKGDNLCNILTTVSGT